MGAQVSEALGVQAEIVTGAAAFFFDQTRGLQHLQVLRHRGAAYWELAGQFADGCWAFAEQVNQALAGGIGERAQHLALVSHSVVSHTLR